MLTTITKDCIDYLPQAVSALENPQTDIPRIAKDKKLLKQIESAVQQIPTAHNLMPVVYHSSTMNLFTLYLHLPHTGP